MSFGAFGKNSGPTGPPKAQLSFGHFSHSPSPSLSTPSFPDSSAPPRSPIPRTFGAYEGIQAQLPFDNGRLGTGPPHPSVAPIRASALQWSDGKNPFPEHVGGPIQKSSSHSGPHGHGASVSPKYYWSQDLERAGSPPVQYMEDFLNPDKNGKEGAVPLRWGNRQSSLAGDVPSPFQKRSSPSNQDDIGANISSGVYRFQDLDNIRSSPIQYNEDFLNPDDDSNKGASSPPKARSGTGVLGMPTFQHSQRSSPSADGTNGIYGKKLVSHSVSKRNRSPPAATTAKISQTNIYDDDDAERELQAKAKRLARFKTELDEAEPNDSIQYGLNVARKKNSLVKATQPAIEKKFNSGDYPSRSTEDMSQDLDNEDLKSGSVIVGLCPDMCPESERAERERKGDLDRYERLNGDRNQTSKILAVKKYNRTAEREAELIRPMSILQKTMNYLLDLLNQPYDDKFLALYNFLWDRMRAIRMDLRMQHIFNLEAITMLEQMIRLHIVAMHELCEFSKGEGFSEGFDAHLNIEQMNKTSVELFQLYDDHRKRGILIPTEKEFRGYYALLKLDKHPGYKVEPAELSLDLAKMTAEIRQTQEVLFARDVARSCRTGNFIAFFRHARKGSYLQACLMHAHFSKLRTQALASLHSGLLNNQGLPVSHASNWLGMEGEDIESLLEYHGFSIKEYEEPYMVKEGPFLNAEKDYPTRCSKLVHQKKSNAIIEDILSSQETRLSYESEKEIQLDKNKKHKQAAIQPKRTESLLVPEQVDLEVVLSPRERMPVQPALQAPRSMNVQPLFETPRTGQTRIENHHKAFASSPKGNITAPNRFGSFKSPSMQNEPSPVTPRDDLVIVDDGQLNYRTPPINLSVTQSLPDAQPPCFGWARKTSNGGLCRSSLGSSPGIVVQSELKATQPHIVSANDEKWAPVAFEVDSGVANSVQDDAVMKVASKEFTDEHQEVKDDDGGSYYDEEVAEAKLKLLIRLWKRRSARKRKFREQNRLSACAALSSLSLGPPIWQIKNKPMHCKKLNIAQTVDERHEKLQQSWARWNVSDVVASKLNEKNMNSNCICWKVISFSWWQQGGDNIEEGKPITHLPLDQWLQYKLIPAREDENADGLVMSAPGMSIWSKWVSNNIGVITCCLSVIKDAPSGNFEKKLDGVSAILFPLSETLPLELQKAEFHNLVMSLPAGACIPILILTGSSENHIGEFSRSIIVGLGINDIDKSRIGSFMVVSLNEREDTDHFHGYFSDLRLKEGLMWLASNSHPPPVLYNVTTRDLVSSHLNKCLDVNYMRAFDKAGPNICISAFNEAVDRSVDNIIAAANTNPTGWACPEVFLFNDCTAEFRAVRQCLPSLGWSSSQEVEPLISALRNCKLPTFSDDISLLNRGCSGMQDLETQTQFLKDSLIRYLTQSSNVMSWIMATKEVDVMLKKCIRLELHDTEYKIVPNWLLIFRRVFNWQLNRLASINHKAYILEQPHFTSNSSFLENSDSEVSAPLFITHPSLDEVVEVSCSPTVSKRVKSSLKCLQDASVVTSVTSFGRFAMSNYLEEEQNGCLSFQAPSVNNSDFHTGENDCQIVPKVPKESDRLSKLLEQCTELQDEIEKKLSVYF